MTALNKGRVIGFIAQVVCISAIVFGYLYNIPFLEYLGVLYVLCVMGIIVVIHTFAFIVAYNAKIEYEKLDEYEKREMEDEMDYEIIEPINIFNLALMNSEVREMYSKYSTFIILYTTIMQIFMFSTLYLTGWLWISYIYFGFMVFNLIMTQKYMLAYRQLDQ